jgi:hypothetical protein
MRKLLLLATAVAAIALAPAAVAAPPAPEAPDLDSASDTGDIATDNITSDSTPTVSVDAGTAQAGQTVTLCNGTTVLGSATVAANGVASVTSSALGDGTVTLTALTGDSATCTPSATVSQPSAGLLLTVDTTAPVISLPPVLLETAGSASDLTYNSKPFLGVYAPAPGDIELYEGTTKIGEAPAEIDGALNPVKVTTALSDGSHTVYAKAVDLAGNASSASPVVVFTVDTTAPTAGTPDLIDDDGESSTDNYTSNPRPRFAVTTEAGARVTLFENGVALGSAIAASNGVATISPNEIVWLDPGQHCVYAIAWDSLANASSETAALCITVAPGVPPFSANLGVSLGAQWMIVSVQANVRGTATVRIVRGGKVVAKAKIKVVPGKKAKVRLKLPPRTRGGRLLVVATVHDSAGRTVVVRRAVRR